MKLTIPTDELKSAVTRVADVVPTKATIPLLEHIRICTFREAENDRTSLIITGTDLDREHSVKIDAEIELDGGACLPSGLLKRFLAGVKGGNISIEADDQFAKLSCGRRRARLAILPSRDFPSIALTEDGAQFVLQETVDLFAPVVHAMSNEETRFYLNGIFLHLRDDRQTLATVATDGHRLAKNQVPAPEIDGAFPDPGVIIPRETVPIIMKMADGEALSVSLTDAKIRVEVEDETLISRLIDGTFPDYDRVIPNGETNRRRVDRDELAEAAQALSVIKNRLAIRSGENGLDLETHDTTGNELTDEVACDFVDAVAPDFGVNTSYLATSLQAFPEDVEIVEISIADAGSPIKVTTESAPEIIQVVMPMQLR